MFGKIALFLFALLTNTIAYAQAPDCPAPGGPKLTLGVYHMELDDHRPICMKLVGSPPTGFFKIKIKSHPSYDVGLVTVKEKDDGDCDGDGERDVTITGNNAASDDELIVAVSGEGLENKMCEFLISAENLGTLDPKVRVVDSNIMRILLSGWFYNALDDLGLTLEEANALAPPPREAE